MAAIAQHRDRQSFGELFDHFGPRAKSYLRRLGASDVLADDLMQEVMLTIWRRADVWRHEELGGVLLDDLDPAVLAEDSKKRVLARLDEAVPEEPVRTLDHVDTMLPLPLRDLVERPHSRNVWRFAGGFSYIPLPSPGGFRVRLLSIRPGHGVPHHTHEGTEMALVLAGGFKETGKQFLRGDVAEADASVDHRQIADPGEPYLVSGGDGRSSAPDRAAGPDRRSDIAALI